MSAADRTIGNYALGELLGRGGSGEVYAAIHRTLGEPVAIKLLRSHLASDDAALTSFIAEATRTRAIDHPNVVRVVDFGHDPDGFYLVMERLAGETLQARLARGPLDEATARKIGAAIADGVAAAHACGIVHRDLKPGNVVLVGDTPKLVDFGIARYFGAEAPATTGSRIGTPAYMAPEQLTGGIVAPCVDVWALGAILYEMIAGAPPFEVADGTCPQLAEPAPRLTGVSPAYAALVAACLAREPGRRPATLPEIAATLRGAHAERFTEDIGPLPLPAEPARPPRRRWVAAGAVLGVLAAGALAWWHYGRSAHDDVATEAAPTPTPAPHTVPSPPPPAATLSVDVRSTPDAADVLIDGKRVATTPATLELDAPTTLVISRRGYKPVSVWADHAGPIVIDLVRAPVPTTHPPTTHPPPNRPAGETLD